MSLQYVEPTLDFPIGIFARTGGGGTQGPGTFGEGASKPSFKKTTKKTAKKAAKKPAKKKKK